MNTRSTVTTQGPNKRAKTIAAWATVPAALIASGLIISQASHAAFTAQTDNSGNSWASGSVVL